MKIATCDLNSSPMASQGSSQGIKFFF